MPADRMKSSSDDDLGTGVLKVEFDQSISSFNDDDFMFGTYKNGKKRFCFMF